MPATQRYFAPVNFKTRFPALDGIRALAVTLVFLAHYAGGAHGGRLLQILNQVRERMGVGVDLFFALSGFLITGILFDTRHDSHYFKRFFARRSVRIFPVFYLLFAVLLVLTPVLHFQWRLSHLSFLLYVGNIVGNFDFGIYTLKSGLSPIADVNLAHLWSLCLEEQFYLVWPIVVWLVKDRVKLLWTAGVIVSFALALRVLAVNVWTPDVYERWVTRTLPFRLDALILGGMLALLLRGEAADRVQRAGKWLFTGGLAAWIALTVISPDYRSPWILTIGPLFSAIWSVGLIAMTLRAESPAFKLFSIQPARILGKYSYGFYVWHLIANQAWVWVLIQATRMTHSPALGGLIALPLCFITSFLVAKASYDWFEVRFLGIKKRFEYDSELRTHQTAFAADGN